MVNTRVIVSSMVWMWMCVCFCRASLSPLLSSSQNVIEPAATDCQCYAALFCLMHGWAKAILCKSRMFGNESLAPYSMIMS